MSKFAACIIAATASLFVLEGCKNALDKDADICRDATKKLKELSKTKHTQDQCKQIANEAMAAEEKLDLENKKKTFRGPGAVARRDQYVREHNRLAQELGLALVECLKSATA